MRQALAAIVLVVLVDCDSTGGRYCGGDVTISSASDLAVYRTCGVVSGQLRISFSSSERVELPLLRHVGSLAIEHNPSLASVSLPSLETVEDGYCTYGVECTWVACQAALSVTGNAALKSLNLPSLARVGSMDILQNSVLGEVNLPSLTSVQASDGCVEPGVEGKPCSADLRVVNNPALKVLSLPSLSTTGSLELSGNTSLSTCDSLGLLARLRAAGYSGKGVVFGNDAVVDCPGQRIRPGPVTVTTAADWDALASRSYTEVAGNLVIQSTDLRTLTSWPALRFVGGSLLIDFNGSLEQINLPGLTGVGGLLRIDGNPVLTSVDGPALMRAFALGLGDNLVLGSLSLPSLAASGLDISGNPALTSVRLPSLRALLGNVGVSVIYRNTGLVRLDLPVLSRAYSLGIGSNPALLTINLPAFSRGGLAVEFNAAVAGLDLPAFTEGTLNVDGNAALVSVAAPALTSLTQLGLLGNPALRSLSVPNLRNVRDLFSVQDNARLPQCQAQSILAQLAAAPPSVVINGNDTTATCPP